MKPGISRLSKRPKRPKAKAIAKAIEADAGRRRTKKQRLAKLKAAGLKVVKGPGAGTLEVNKEAFLRPEKGTVPEGETMSKELEETKAALARKTSKVADLEAQIRDLKAAKPAPASCPIPVKDETRVEVPKPGFDLGAAADAIETMIGWVESQSGQDAPKVVREFTDWLDEVRESV